jgi:hypothetical protein
MINCKVSERFTERFIFPSSYFVSNRKQIIIQSKLPQCRSEGITNGETESDCKAQNEEWKWLTKKERKKQRAASIPMASSIEREKETRASARASKQASM